LKKTVVIPAQAGTQLSTRAPASTTGSRPAPGWRKTI